MAQPRPADEHAHAPGTEDAWSESWGFDFGTADGTAGFVRLHTWPQRGTAWWWAYLVGSDVGLVVVRDHEVPLPHRSDVLEIRADSLWGELVCETPFEHWGIGMEAFGVRLDDDSALTAAGDEIGDRVAVGLDLEWEVVSPVATSARSEADGGYSQGGIVHGELLARPRSHSHPRARQSRSLVGELARADPWTEDDRAPRRRVRRRCRGGRVRRGRRGGCGSSATSRCPSTPCSRRSSWTRQGIPIAARWVLAHRVELDVDLGAPVRHRGYHAHARTGHRHDLGRPARHGVVGMELAGGVTLAAVFAVDGVGGSDEGPRRHRREVPPQPTEPTRRRGAWGTGSSSRRARA